MRTVRLDINIQQNHDASENRTLAHRIVALRIANRGRRGSGAVHAAAVLISVVGIVFAVTGDPRQCCAPFSAQLNAFQAVTKAIFPGLVRIGVRSLSDFTSTGKLVFYRAQIASVVHLAEFAPSRCQQQQQRCWYCLHPRLILIPHAFLPSRRRPHSPRYSHAPAQLCICAYASLHSSSS
ncbi:hypothetical protein Aduo_008515 [Ancylostoma duodenale]